MELLLQRIAVILQVDAQVTIFGITMPTIVRMFCYTYNVIGFFFHSFVNFIFKRLCHLIAHNKELFLEEYGSSTICQLIMFNYYINVD